MLPKSRVAFCLLLLSFLTLTVSSVDNKEGLSPLKQTPVCMKGQFVLNGMCQPCFLQTQFCKECGNINSKSLSNCYTCEPFFTISPNYTCVRCLATNCISCSYNSKTCKACETKYFLTSEGNCERCPNNCGKCDTDTDQPVCLPSGCAIGTAFVVNASTGSCVACAHRSCIDCSDPQSGLLLSNGTCAKCINNYYLSQDNFCFPCMLHCSKCNLGNCSQCDIGFYMSPATSSSGPQCLKCSHPCLECTSLNFCTRCDPGHYLKAESNITNDCMSCFIPACQTCLVNVSIQNQTTCSLCGPGYLAVLQTGKCFPCVPNCLTCGSYTTCLRCNIGYFKNGTSTSIQCVACMFKCATCSSTTVCNVCQPSYFLTNNICLPCPLYCLSCPEGVCQKCRDGYSAKGETPNLCTPCTPPCLTCLSSQECTSCQSGYYQSRGQCLNCQKSCIHCLGVGQCFSCHEGYYAMAQNQVGGSACAQCPVGCTRCKMMSGSLGCQSCEEGFLLVSTTCAEMSGMPWWGIFLIVTFTLLIFVGVGYLIRRNYSSGGTGGYGYVEMGRT